MKLLFDPLKRFKHIQITHICHRELVKRIMVNKRKISWAKSAITRCFNSANRVLLTIVKLTHSHNFNPQFLEFFWQIVLVLLGNFDILFGEGTFFNLFNNIYWVDEVLSNSCSVINVPNDNRFDWIELSKRRKWESDVILPDGPFCRSVLLSKRETNFLFPILFFLHFNLIIILRIFM